jgi:Fe-Mn family superoxide dismutase
MPKALPLLQPIQLKESLFEMEGISERTVQEHQAMYERYIKRYNDIVNLLEQVNRDPERASSTYSPLRVLKIEMTYALGGVRHHELYFDHLGGEGGKPKGPLATQINEWFGSFNDWVTDLTSTALCSRGWTWLAWDREGQYLFHYLGDVNNTFPVWNATPILALDMYEHAYFLDFKQDRRAYIKAFLDNLDWDVISQRFEAATR